MTRSAVDIPTQTLKQLLGLGRDFHAPLPMVVSLLESIMTSMWSKTFGNEGLEYAMVEINVLWTDDLLAQMRRDGQIGEMCVVSHWVGGCSLLYGCSLDFLRYSLVTCLLVYGCARQTITSLGLIRPEELRYLSQRYVWYPTI